MLSELDVFVLYTIFTEFLKILSFASKPKEVSLRVYQKTSVHDKN
jgi:hypothetical protein